MQALSTTGTPFYINLPSVLLKKCLANHNIAGRLNRYPQFTPNGVLRKVSEGSYHHLCYQH